VTKKHDAQERQEGRDREEDGASDAGEGAAQVEELVAPDGVGEDGDRRQVGRPADRREVVADQTEDVDAAAGGDQDRGQHPAELAAAASGRQRRQENAGRGDGAGERHRHQTHGQERCGPPTA